jgi:hypothetical protein
VRGSRNFAVSNSSIILGCRIGWTLVVVGALTTISLAMQLLGADE